jgi:hypothetical protein
MKWILLTAAILIAAYGSFGHLTFWGGIAATLIVLWFLARFFEQVEYDREDRERRGD